ncbi:ras-GEF domain-containing family member 1A isoform X2 [Lepisosteus oculatus]|uniref:ras-GEF domain-containing family member 1A isoform X2 n=1 Tax=Lepisosteus oculatus TaxID=7918 RepID=UPI00073FEB0C|nr:PREDICTED: ras-GEF domain-containing family member 1A isoform X3 [Lepisosteus oculatus]
MSAPMDLDFIPQIPKETMPQTALFPSMLGSECSGQVPVDMRERSVDLIFQDGSLVSGSLEALIERLVPTLDYYPDRTYIFTFLLTTRIFIHPSELLARVGQICLKQKQQLEMGPEMDKVKLKLFSAKIVQLLREWTETFPCDFEDRVARKELKEIVWKICHCDEGNSTIKKSLNHMMESLDEALSTRDQHKEVRGKITPGLSEKGTLLKVKSQSTHKDILSVCSDALVFAQQLTHIELEKIRNIQPEDVIHLCIQTGNIPNHKCCDSKKTQNVEAYENWFNQLSTLVATEICRVVKKKQRTRIVEFFIDVARECFNIGNFNSLMAIISGMNLSPVARLKKTWSKVKTAKFDILEHYMDPSSNFCNYRTALQGAAQRSRTAHTNCEKIVIPVYSLFVKDIYFLNKMHSDTLPNGHINFKKYWEISRQISDFMIWRAVECPFEISKRIQNYLLTAPIYTEEALYIASFESEGPENHREKDSLKTLRAMLNRA